MLYTSGKVCLFFIQENCVVDHREMDAWWWEANTQKDALVRALLSFSIIIISGCIWAHWKAVHRNSKLPPGPQGLPIVGNLPFIHSELHRYFSNLTNKYGPIIKVKLGSNLVIVLSSAELAEVVLKEFDSTFANRFPTVAGMVLSYGGSDMGFANGPQWRNARSFCVREILSKDTLTSFSTLCQQEIRRTLRSLYANVNTPVLLTQEIHMSMLNMILNMLLGGTFNDEQKIRIGLEFGCVAEEVVEYVGQTNISDFLPVLARFDLQGVERRMKELISWLDSFFSSIIEQRMKLDGELKLKGDQDGNKNDFKDVLQVFLELQDQGEFKTSFTITNLRATAALSC